jgi:hypothetical protein
MSEVQSPPGYLQQTLPVTWRSSDRVFAINLNSFSYAPGDERSCNELSAQRWQQDGQRNNQCVCSLFLVSLFVSVFPVLTESGRLLGDHVYCVWSFVNSLNSWPIVTQFGGRMNFWGGSKTHTTSYRTLQCLTPDLNSSICGPQPYL